MCIKNIFNNKITIQTNVSICGWVKNKRNSKIGISFIDLYDGSDIRTIQVIVHSSIENYSTEILKLTTGCSIVVNGLLTYSKGIKQKYEIKANKVKVIGWINNPKTYPIAAKKHTFEHLREVSHLRARTSIFGSITRIRNYVFQCIQKFFYSRNFFWIPTPIITEINTEGAGNMFRVSTLDNLNLSNIKKNNFFKKKDFFGKETFLTVSGQLTLETYACAVSKVYNFGPVFRAEPSNTTRHLSEFWMCEVEQAFANLKQIIFLAENMLQNIVKKTLNACSLEIDFLEKTIDPTINKRLYKFVNEKFVEIEYSDAIDILKSSKIKFSTPVNWGNDFSTDQERFFVEKYFLKPVIIKNYPKQLKAFYMKLNEDELTVSAMDILVPKIGEIIGGSQREDRLHILDNRLSECQLKSKDYWWYRDLRKYGTVPHSGFGLGFERLLCYITGLNNVKDMIPFPRTINNSNF